MIKKSCILSLMIVAILIAGSSCTFGPYSPNRDVMNSAEWDCYLKIKNELDNGADINNPSYFGSPYVGASDSMLTYALRKGYHEVVRFLLSKGADINKADGGNYTPLIQACSMGDLEMINLLLDKHADVRINGEFNTSPLQYFAMAAPYDKISERPEEYAAMVDRLIESGCDVNYVNHSGQSVLDFAVTNEMNSILRQRGAKSALRTKFGNN